VTDVVSKKMTKSGKKLFVRLDEETESKLDALVKRLAKASPNREPPTKSEVVRELIRSA
jgi:predicted DNA-binding protein